MPHHAPLIRRLRRTHVRGVGLAALVLMSACDRSLTRDVHDGAKLTARVQGVVRPGSDSAGARRVLEVQGFHCVTRLGTDVDTLEKELEPPPNRLTCQKSGKAPRAATNHFLVDVLLDGPTVRGIEARMWVNHQP